MSGSECAGACPDRLRTLRRRGAVVAALAGAVLLAAAGDPALAQTAQRVALSLMVTHATPGPGPVDPLAAHLHESLRDDFRYGSLVVLQQRRLMLRPGEIGGLELPTGKRVRVRPLHMGAGSVLIAVDIENTLHTDVRVPDRRPVVIGVDRYDGGKLILTLEPELPLAE